MKIILISTMSNLGKIGDVVEVKNGYAKNFLIPNKKAICFTSNNYKIFESKKEDFEKENLKNLDISSQVKEKTFGKNVIIIQNASDDGRLYGSVNSAIIASKINDILGAKNISRSNIFLKKPIKEIGIYQVKVSLHSEVSFELKLIVSRSESEIEALLKAEKKEQTKDSNVEAIEEESVVEKSAKNSKKQKNKNSEISE